MVKRLGGAPRRFRRTAGAGRSALGLASDAVTVTVELALPPRVAGVDVLLEVEEDLPHVFQVFATTPEATASTDGIGAFLRGGS